MLSYFFFLFVVVSLFFFSFIHDDIILEVSTEHCYISSYAKTQFVISFKDQGYIFARGNVIIFVWTL